MGLARDRDRRPARYSVSGIKLSRRDVLLVPEPARPFCACSSGQAFRSRFAYPSLNRIIIPIKTCNRLGSDMDTHARLAMLFALAFAAGLAAPAQTPVTLKSPNGALELLIASLQGQSVQESGGQLAYRVAFRGKPVLDWSNLGLAIQGVPILGSAVRIESAKNSASDETWNSVAGKANPI